MLAMNWDMGSSSSSSPCLPTCLTMSSSMSSSFTMSLWLVSAHLALIDVPYEWDELHGQILYQGDLTYDPDKFLPWVTDDSRANKELSSKLKVHLGLFNYCRLNTNHDRETKY